MKNSDDEKNIESSEKETIEIKREKKEEEKKKRYIYVGENILEDGIFLKHKSIYDERHMGKIRKMKNYGEHEDNFLDLDEYSKNY